MEEEEEEAEEKAEEEEEEEEGKFVDKVRNAFHSKSGLIGGWVNIEGKKTKGKDVDEGGGKLNGGVG